MLHLIAGKETYTKEILDQNLKACEKCRSFEIKIKVFKEYFHFYHIPTFPLKTKLVSIHCNGCGGIIFSRELEEKYKLTFRAPIILYLGSIIIVFLIFGLALLILQGDRSTEEYYNDPKKGDVYSIRQTAQGTDFYTSYKLMEIKKDTFVFYPNNGDYFDINKKVLWPSYKREIMFDSGLIWKIERD